MVGWEPDRPTELLSPNLIGSDYTWVGAAQPKCKDGEECKDGENLE